MYLDANVFVLAAIEQGPKSMRARVLLQSIIQGKHATTSALALDEVMWTLIRNAQKPLVRPLIEEIYTIRNLNVKEVPADAPLRALEFMERHKLKPRDALHAAVMEHFGEREIVSDDADFDRVPSVKRVKV